VFKRDFVPLLKLFPLPLFKGKGDRVITIITGNSELVARNDTNNKMLIESLKKDIVVFC
jgi:hypothetical protein